MVSTSKSNKPPAPTTSGSDNAGERYHHGNLRQVLLDHAVTLARTGGPDAVVLRDVQRMAGVSNSAAYRHYSDREALLSAVTDYALSRLAAAMTAALQAVRVRGPRDRRALARLRATGQAYIDFALAEPGLFRTAFAAETAACRGGHEDAPPFQVLISCIDDLVEAGVVAPATRPGLDAAAWAGVHGLAVLFLDGSLAELDAKSKRQVVERLLQVFAAGLS